MGFRNKARWATLTTQAIHIYSVLMYHVNNETRKCFPAYTTLESMTGMSRSTIWKYLKILKDAGVLTWERRAFKGFTTSNKYFLPHKPLKDVELYKQESYITEKEVAEDDTGDTGFELDTIEDSGFGVSEEAGIQKKRAVTAPMPLCLSYKRIWDINHRTANTLGGIKY